MANRTVLKRTDSVLSGIENVIAVGSLLLAFLLAIVSVILRNITGDVIFWAEEAIIYLIIYSTFFGAVVTLRHNEHVNVDILPTLLKGRVRRTIVVIGSLITLVFAVITAVLSWMLIFEPFSQSTITPALKLPLWVLELSVPLAMTLFSIRTVQMVVHALTARDEDLFVDHTSDVDAEALAEESGGSLDLPFLNTAPSDGSRSAKGEEA